MHAQIFSDSCSCIFGGSIRGITKMPQVLMPFTLILMSIVSSQIAKLAEIK
jgi:hypothetical protein